MTVSGTAEPNSTVKLFDGPTQVGTIVADAAGVWSIGNVALNSEAVGPTIVPVVHTLTATATDASGNTSAPSAIFTAIYDSGPPAVTESLLNDTGISPSDLITSDPTLTGSGDANAVVHFTIDGNSVATTATADANGVWTFTPTGLAAGQHTIVASETDAAGNTGTASLTVTLSGVTIDGTAENDTIDATHTVAGQSLPTDYNDIINGLGGNDILYGLAGNDLLDGGSGADTMLGGAGNDAYVVDNVGDVVTENPARASIQFCRRSRMRLAPMSRI